MQKIVIVTWVLKALGFILVLLSLFGHEIILNVFPGLEGMSINPIFYSGIVIYLVGAVIYFFVNKKERADRRRRQIEESYKVAGLGDSSDDSDDDSDDSATEGAKSESANVNSNEK
jgi:predicted membrane channel-forming protein YqfA (hemolysin III family)